MPKEEKKKTNFVNIRFYEEEVPTVTEFLKSKDIELVGETLNSRDIRKFFGLKETHRQAGAKSKIKELVANMSVEEQEALLKKLSEE